MLRRLIEARLVGVRRLANEVVDGFDDRSKLFALELAAEQQRLLKLVLLALGALIVSILALVWGAATLVAFTWDTEWRHATLLALLAFWVLCALSLCVKLRSVLKAGEESFRLSRQVATDDFTRLRETIR